MKIAKIVWLVAEFLSNCAIDLCDWAIKTLVEHRERAILLFIVFYLTNIPTVWSK